VLNGENVAIESGGPLFAFHSHLQIAQGVADIPLDFAPKKLRIALYQIGRALTCGYAANCTNVQVRAL